MLVFAWLAGTFWTLVGFVFRIHIEFEEDLHEPDASLFVVPPLPSATPVALGSAALAATGGVRAQVGWPLALLRPEGLACHDGLGSFAVLAGRHAVRTVPLGSNLATAEALTAAEVEVAINECLESAPSFLSRGIIDLSLECPADRSSGELNGPCIVLLLGADGMRGLRCALPGAHPQASTAAALASRLLGPVALRGGPWEAVAASGSEDGSVWALARGGCSVVQLRPREGAPDELLPYLDMPLLVEGCLLGDVALGDASAQRADAGGRLHLDVRGGRLLQVSRSSRLLRAWSLSGGPPLTWRLPEGSAGQSLRGLCTASSALGSDGNVVLLAELGLGAPRGQKADFPFGLWRVPLPLPPRDGSR